MANQAETSPDHVRPGLRGRTYAIPFEQVWQAARSLAGGGLRGWRIIEEDDYEGIIIAESQTLVWRFVDDVVIRIILDHDAQTRVDMQSSSRKGGFDFGTNARRIGKFFRALDARLHKPKPTPARR